jgi:2-(1,2-epoxy-1,2-dihydrophenyl)acetyl-CoA isomerase
MTGRQGDVSYEVGSDGVATVEIHRPPNNFFDFQLIQDLATVYEAFDEDPAVRAIVLCAEGKHFCAGANFSGNDGRARSDGVNRATGGDLYGEAVRLIEAGKPVVAAVHGAAIGGGLGLACSADFRVGCKETRMASNFAQLGFHHGFGLTITLPPIVGQQRALEMLYTGKRLTGDEAHTIGLLDRLVPLEDVRDAARAFAAEIASSAPLAVASIRSTMRQGIGDRYRLATARERKEQDRLQQTQDFQEGIKASSERRPPAFQGR